MKKKGIHPPKFSKKKFITGLPVLNHHAAGIDVGDTFHAVAINDGTGGLEVREYQSFTADLTHLVSWLKAEGITTAAMESTGVYWLNLYLMLEEAGIEPYLVNAKHVKNVTGRKKDDTDAMWLQRLHSCGLLQKCFQPDTEIRVLRTFVRQRKNLLRMSSDSVRRMQKALELMNIKLHTVISDLLGKTGMAMVAAILDGERDAASLLQFKDRRIKASDEVIVKSLEAVWKPEYLFMLQQAYDQYCFLQSQVESCNKEIESQLLRQVAQVNDGDISELSPGKKKPKKNEFSFNAECLLSSLLGTNLCDVPGVGETTAVELIAEIGTDMSKWPNAKHAAAWMNLAPNVKITGGKVISSKVEKKKNRAGQALRMAANSLHSNKSTLGAYARKMKSKLGKKGGVVATAHKLCRIIYTMIKEKIPYDQTTIDKSQQIWKERRIKYLEKELKNLKKAS